MFLHNRFSLTVSSATQVSGRRFAQHGEVRGLSPWVSMAAIVSVAALMTTDTWQLKDWGWLANGFRRNGEAVWCVFFSFRFFFRMLLRPVGKSCVHSCFRYPITGFQCLVAGRKFVRVFRKGVSTFPPKLDS